ncbi:MAG: hypothetical protein AAFQ90_03475 [Pseudomonadota bacterium]
MAMHKAITGIAMAGMAAALAGCGGSDPGDEGAAPSVQAGEGAQGSVLLDLAAPCDYLTSEDVSAVFDGVEFVQKPKAVDKIDEFGVLFSECDYEVLDGGPGRYINVEFALTEWQGVDEASEYYSFTKPAGGEEFTALEGIGDEASYEGSFAKDGLIRAGKYTFFLEVRRPGVEDADLRTPTIELMKKIGERI